MKLITYHRSHVIRLFINIHVYAQWTEGSVDRNV